MGRLEFGDQDPEDVEEEAKVGQDAEESRIHVEPLHPLVGRLCRQGPAQLVVNVNPEDAVQDTGYQREPCKGQGGNQLLNSCVTYPRQWTACTEQLRV